ncbi:amino acid permease [Terrilactibacillus sp. BCM23-1]|uniref:Amino acid permease n=1 Tax=Terrilactibacillus tamarindi TaxID=2599694 RepID=A0A6N8CTH2_9BACI|nr:amino acid permease [Terrilactibacillus tamarindi]MTT32333.1 amino acid permease [Terrilactibacillus tamarindi]
MKKKLGPLLLSGLLIGPILGSGIILLPPLIYKTTGDYAIVAWIMILTIGFLFAMLFGKLSVAFPSEKGIAHTAELAFGPLASKLSACFFIGATFIGPMAVLMTASVYIHQLFPGFPSYIYGFMLLPICVGILLTNIRFISKVSFIFASVAVIILLSGSIVALFHEKNAAVFETNFHLGSFGYGILLLFWALVGWEMIGNYSLEVKKPQSTIPRAIVLSSIVVTLVSVLVALAIQRVPESNHVGDTIIGILTPLYGNWAGPLISFITIVLCISTYLQVMGSVTRLIASMTQDTRWISLLAYRNKRNIPITAILGLSLIHICVLVLVSLDLLNIQKIVAVANAFFLCNACFGIAAGWKLLDGWLYKVITTGLLACFLVILAFSSLWVIGIIALILASFTLIHLRKRSCLTS